MRASRDREIALLGVPIEAGTGRRGAAMGPAALRIADLQGRLSALGWSVRDLGDLTPLAPDAVAPLSLRGTAREAEVVAGWIRPLAARAYELSRSGCLPVFLGGDHALSMGSVAGVARHWQEQGRPLFVLWLDAHADYNTPDTSPSGNLHGMALASLAGEAELAPLMGDQAAETVAPGRMCVFGARSIDPGERALLRARGVQVCDMRRIDEEGVSLLMKQFLQQVKEEGGVLHVSLDVDFLDPDLAPGVGTTVPGGATYREAHLVMELLEDAGLTVSLDVVELNPFLDVRGQSALVLAELVASLFGQDVMDRPTQAFA